MLHTVFTLPTLGQKLPTINFNSRTIGRCGEDTVRTVYPERDDRLRLSSLTSKTSCLHQIRQILAKAKVYSGKVQLQLNIHECRQLVPCPIAFLIKPETPGTTHRGPQNSMELGAHASKGERCRAEWGKWNVDGNLGNVYFFLFFANWS